MKVKRTIIFVISIIISIQSIGQKAINDIQTGNNLYKQKIYDQAGLKYNDALTKEPSNTTAKFNLANTLYRNNKQNEATKELDNLITAKKDAGLRSKSYY